jgi:hypothetical protein
VNNFPKGKFRGFQVAVLSRLHPNEGSCFT